MSTKLIVPSAPTQGQALAQIEGQNLTTQSRITTLVFWAVAVAVALIALGSFALSFENLHDLAATNGKPGPLAWIWPGIVDLSLVVFTGSILIFQLLKLPPRFPIALTICYGGVTVTGNLLHAPDNPVGWFVAALPPVSLLLTTELLRELAKHRIEAGATTASLAELRHQQQATAADLDKLNRLAATAQDKLNTIKKDTKEAKSGQSRRSVQELQQARQDKIDKRRSEVLLLLDKGEDPKIIAETMGVSIKTIKRDIKELNGAIEAAQPVTTNGNGGSPQ